MHVHQKDFGGWISAGYDLWMLGMEASMVMTLRTARIAAGGTAGANEAELMLTEKIRAAVEIQAKLLSGAMGHSPLTATQGALRHYRRKVAANSKRLTA